MRVCWGRLSERKNLAKHCYANRPAKGIGMLCFFVSWPSSPAPFGSAELNRFVPCNPPIFKNHQESRSGLEMVRSIIIHPLSSHHSSLKNYICVPIALYNICLRWHIPSASIASTSILPSAVPTNVATVQLIAAVANVINARQVQHRFL